jgi:GNAT superfamily N-acetyltransferase/acyl carrier protein
MAARSQQPPDAADALVAEVAVVVRRAIGIDDTRSLPVDEPLGALGLDSLSLVSAVVAVEEAFACELRHSVWEDRRGISIATLAEAVDAAPVTPSGSSQPSPARGVSDRDQPGFSRLERVFLRLEEHGAASRSAAHAVQRALIAAHRLHSRQTFLVLERELSGRLPQIAVPAGISIAPYDGVSEAPLGGIWTGTQTRRLEAHRQRRRHDGMHCLAAWENGRIVAFDLLAPTGAEDIATRPGTCLGAGLYERRAPRGRGIGLALLSASLPYARDLGYARQATIVLERNLPVIAAATQLLGFAVTNRAERSERLGRITWTWRLHGSICSGSRLFV